MELLPHFVDGIMQCPGRAFLWLLFAGTGTGLKVNHDHRNVPIAKTSRCLTPHYPIITVWRKASRKGLILARYSAWTPQYTG
jgi:hypothetical protein